MLDKLIETDVLVIGGGLAGCFAAMRASELGVDVTLVDKNYVGKTGCSYYATSILVFNEEWGDDFEAWKAQFVKTGEYVVDQRWVEIVLRESYPRFLDLVSWGIPFYRKDGTVGPIKPGEEPRRRLPGSKYRPTATMVDFGVKGKKLLIVRKRLLERGVRILDRVMITDLLMHGGRVVGVVGFNTVNGNFYIIKAKATVIASGGLGYRGVRYGTEFNTSDGLAMAYRAGAEMISMEFQNIMWVAKKCDTIVIDGPGEEMGLGPDRVTNGRGEEFLDGPPHYPTNILWALEVHAGRGPIYREPYGVDREKFKDAIKRYEEGPGTEGPWMLMLDRAGLDIFKEKIEEYMAHDPSTPFGGIRVNYKCETTVPGLYAAGDAAGTNINGANYVALGLGMAHAAVTGYRAGQSAAEYALKVEKVDVSESEIERLRDVTYAPLRRESGFSTDHVLLRIHQTVHPYEIWIVMHEKRLKAALTMIEFFRDHFLPRMKAVDPHDLRKAHEIHNIITGVEMRLRAALFRKESRGLFFREDYPCRDDENWLKWVILKKEDEEMKVWTEPIPKEWWGDISMPYEERYILHYKLG